MLVAPGLPHDIRVVLICADDLLAERVATQLNRSAHRIQFARLRTTPVEPGHLAAGGTEAPELALIDFRAPDAATLALVAEVARASRGGPAGAVALLDLSARVDLESLARQGVAAVVDAAFGDEERREFEQVIVDYWLKGGVDQLARAIAIQLHEGDGPP
jgi:CheY-like chemotaxis protein